MALKYSPKLVTDGLITCLDASQNTSLPTYDLPVKSGLVMWMDASDDSAFSYSSGTTVSQWRDKSGLNYHMIPISAGPTRSSFLNSRKVLAFTTSQTIGSLSLDLETSANTVFVVSRYTSSSTNTNRVLTSYYNNWLLGHWGSYVNEYYAVGWIAYALNSADTTWRIYMGDWGGSSNDVADAFSNGNSIRNQTASNAAAGPKGLGINYQSSEPSTCEAAEIIVFNRTLSAKERKLVHTYLGLKWGISNFDRSVVDVSGNNNDGLLGNGTIANMPLVDFYNKNAFKFDGTNDYIKIGTNSSLQSNTITIGAFFKTLNNSQSTQFIAGYGDTGIAGYWIGMSGGPILFSVGGGSGNYLQLNSTVTPNNDQIYYVVGTYDGTNQKIYVDSVLKNSATTVTGNISYTGLTDGFLLGQIQGFSSLRYLTGSIYNLHVYNRALTATEISQNYEALKARFSVNIVQKGLVLNLDAGNPYSYAGSGTTWYDVSGNSYNGTLTNGPSYSTINGGAIILDGSDDYSLSSVSSITDSSTVSIWIKSSAYNNKIPISIDGTNYGSGPNIFFYNNTINWNIGDSGANPFSNSSYPDSNWHYIVITNDSSTNAKLYIDGTLIGTATYKSTLSSGSNNFWIGRYHGDNNYTIAASIGSVQLYNRVLSAVEVLQNYNAMKGRFGL